MENIDDLFLHSIVHPDVAAAYISGGDVPEAILRQELPDTSAQPHIPDGGSKIFKILTGTVVDETGEYNIPSIENVIEKSGNRIAIRYLWIQSREDISEVCDLNYLVIGDVEYPITTGEPKDGQALLKWREELVDVLSQNDLEDIESIVPDFSAEDGNYLYRSEATVFDSSRTITGDQQCVLNADGDNYCGSKKFTAYFIGGESESDDPDSDRDPSDQKEPGSPEEGKTI